MSLLQLFSPLELAFVSNHIISATEESRIMRKRCLICSSFFPIFPILQCFIGPAGCPYNIRVSTILNRYVLIQKNTHRYLVSYCVIYLLLYLMMCLTFHDTPPLLGFSDRREERPRGGGGARRSDYGVIVTNLPKSCSWQVKYLRLSLLNVVFLASVSA